MAGVIPVCLFRLSWRPARPVLADDPLRSRFNEDGGVGICSSRVRLTRSRRVAFRATGFAVTLAWAGALAVRLGDFAARLGGFATRFLAAVRRALARFGRLAARFAPRAGRELLAFFRRA